MVEALNVFSFHHFIGRMQAGNSTVNMYGFAFAVILSAANNPYISSFTFYLLLKLFNPLASENIYYTPFPIQEEKVLPGG